ncbi:MAG: hypothetical protein ABGZ24_01695 [Fuerstiella sp.]|jgi:hypothetical protein
MTFAATPTLASKVQVDIAATYTDIPGTQNIEVTGEDNSSFKNGGIADDCDTNKGTGVSDPGGCKFSMLFDPADTVHQDLQDRHNAGGVGVPIKVFISATGATKAATCTLKKFDLKADKKGGWMADVEFECEDRWIIVDPV